MKPSRHPAARAVRFQKLMSDPVYREKRRLLSLSNARKKQKIRRNYLRPRLVSQGFKCAICQAKITIKTAKLDHCHTTGVLRDALCHGCNAGIGPFREDVEFLRSAINYVEKWKGKVAA